MAKSSLMKIDSILNYTARYSCGISIIIIWRFRH